MISRRDVLQIALTLSLAAALALAFPRMRPAATVGGTSRPVCAMIRLTPEDEQRAISIARTAWQLDRGQAKRLRLRMLEETLPEMPPRIVVGFEADGGGEVERANTGYAPELLPESLAAPSPEQLPVAPNASESEGTFSRQELLWLN